MSRLDFLYKRNIQHRAVAVYLYLDSRADTDTDQCFPSLRTIARDLKLSVSTVQRALDDLEKEKLIIKEQRYRDSGGKSSILYTLFRPEGYHDSY